MQDPPTLSIHQVFVYGTLKRGQCREHAWPHEPKTIRDAAVLGALFGRDDYPALKPGDDLVAGELWEFKADEIQQVLWRLDQIEVYNQPRTANLYERVVCKVVDYDGETLGDAWTYHCLLYTSDAADE